MTSVTHSLHKLNREIATKGSAIYTQYRKANLSMHRVIVLSRRASSGTLIEDQKAETTCEERKFLAIRDAPTPIIRKHIECCIYVCIAAMPRLSDFYAAGNSREFIHSAGVKVAAFLRQFLNSFRRDAPTLLRHLLALPLLIVCCVSASTVPYISQSNLFDAVQSRRITNVSPTSPSLRSTAKKRRNFSAFQCDSAVFLFPLLAGAGMEYSARDSTRCSSLSWACHRSSESRYLRSCRYFGNFAHMSRKRAKLHPRIDR